MRWYQVLICFLSLVSPRLLAAACTTEFVGGHIVSSIDAYYTPGVPFTLEIQPAAADWPTTPSIYEWNDNGNVFTSESPVLEIVVPAPGPESVFYRVEAVGPFTGPNCPLWATPEIRIQLRRIDLGTPTPIPVPTPTPTATPCPIDCSSRILSPPTGLGAPLQDTTVVFRLAEGSFPHVLQDVKLTHTIPLTKTAEQEWVAEGLHYDTWYEFSWHCGVRCDGLVLTAFNLFKTRPKPLEGMMVGKQSFTTDSLKDSEHRAQRLEVRAASLSERFPFPPPPPPYSGAATSD